MRQKRSLLFMIFYGFLATLAICYGLIERQSLLATFIAFHLFICLGVPIIHAWREGTLKMSWREAWGTAKFSRSGMLLGVVSGVVLLIAAVVGIWLLLRSVVDPEWIRLTLFHWGLSDEWIWIFAFYNIVVNSFLEELLWRGFVQERLLYGISRRKAIIVSSSFFALYHLVLGVVLFGWKWGAIFTGLVFLVGLFWGWMKVRYPSVYPTWSSHLLADLGLMISLFLWVF